MDILTFIERNGLRHRLLYGLMGHSGKLSTDRLNEMLFGKKAGSVGGSRSPKWFVDFKDGVKAYACGLYGSDRLDLYLEVKDLVTALREQGYVSKSVKYELKDSFLSHDEINLIILKKIQEPITQEKLANEVLGCSRNTVVERLGELKDGYRLGDMSVTIAPERGGKLQSTVHPILLPLNLSEVYVLLSALGEQTRDLSREDPHWAILRDIASKIYFQLTDYARARIDDRLAEHNLEYMRGTPPVYAGDQQTHTRNTTGNSISWAFFEKAHVPVEIICDDGKGNESRYVGYMDNWNDATPYLDPGADVNPKHCFIVKGFDGSRTAVSWENVVDVRSAPHEGDAPDINRG